MPPCRNSLPHLLATPCHTLPHLATPLFHTSLLHLLVTPPCHTLPHLLATPPCHTSLPHLATPLCYTSLSHLIVTPPCVSLLLVCSLSISLKLTPIATQFFTKCCMSIFVDITDNGIRIQWNLSIVDTIGTQLAVLYREMSPIQR